MADEHTLKEAYYKYDLPLIREWGCPYPSMAGKCPFAWKLTQPVWVEVADPRYPKRTIKVKRGWKPRLDTYGRPIWTCAHPSPDPVLPYAEHWEEGNFGEYLPVDHDQEDTVGWVDTNSWTIRMRYMPDTEEEQEDLRLKVEEIEAIRVATDDSSLYLGYQVMSPDEDREDWATEGCLVEHNPVRIPYTRDGSGRMTRAYNKPYCGFLPSKANRSKGFYSEGAGRRFLPPVLPY